LAATGIFIAFVRIVGGPSESDAAESVYATWTIAHGHLACAYPPAVTTYRFPTIARPVPFITPLWPLLSGGVAALTRIGHGVPFPSQTALGPHCSTALVAMFKWSVKSGAAKSTVHIAYLSWLVLMGGVVALLRASGRGRCGWEPATLVLACVPSVFMPVVEFFHPQDLVALGLALGGLACARRGWWVWAGVLLGLAVTSQQFALLVAAPLVVLAPTNRRVRFAVAAIGAATLVVVPLIVVTSGRAIRAATLGSGNTSSFGGTVLRELHVNGGLLVVFSRILPIVVSMALARWAVRRLGHAVLEPVPLVSLIATSLSLRLAFEENLFGYYFMALAVSLVLLDIFRGRIREQLVAWLVLVTLAFSPVPWGFASNSVAWGLQEREFLPFACMAVVLGLIVFDIVRRRIRWYLVAWFVVVAVAFARLPWTNPPFRHDLPPWYWQVVLVSTGVALAAGPLVAFARNRAVSDPVIFDDDNLSV
jgi:hypothetical protein